MIMNRLRRTYADYTPAFWILVGCFFINRIAASLVWPFVGVFINKQTGASMESITGLFSLQAITSIVGTSVVSSLMDRFGRKKIMMAGLFLFSLLLLVMSQADQFGYWVVIIPFYGVLQSVFYVGSNAMVADLVREEQRSDAYAITRTAANLAISLGPTVGGFLIARSYLFAYYSTATLNLLLLLPVFLYISESLVKVIKDGKAAPQSTYWDVLRDHQFVSFMLVFTLIEIATAMVFTLMSVYAKTRFGIPEDQIGQIIGINAVMVVLFQFFVTRFTRRFPPYAIMAAGALVYAVGVTSYAFATSFGHFAAGMVIITTGEMIVMPTAVALVAAMSPPDMRARYMGIYSLTYTLGMGVGPVIAGVLGASAMWFGGGAAALLAALGFGVLALVSQRRLAQPAIKSVS